MTPTSEDLANIHGATGKNFVSFGTGTSLPVTHIGNTTVQNNIPLKNVLVVPHITKRLLSVS